MLQRIILGIGLVIAVAGVPQRAHAQPYPSPTVQNITVLGAFNGPITIPALTCDNVTDNTAVLQAAANLGGDVFLTNNGTGQACILGSSSTPTLGSITISKSVRFHFAPGTMLSWPQVNVAGATANMFVQGADLADVVFDGCTLRGNLSAQTSAGGANGLWGIYLRNGSLQRLTIQNCRIFNFGTKYMPHTLTQGGPVALGSVSGLSKVLTDITIQNSIFEDNGNVPGPYINAQSANVSSAGQIHLVNDTCRLSSTSGLGAYASQNCFFVVGDTGIQVDGVDFTNLIFDLNEPLDTLGECDYCNSVTAANWTGHYHGTVSHSASVGIDLRGTINGFSVSGFAVNNDVNGDLDDWFEALQYNSGELISNGAVSGNTPVDWGSGASVLAGSTNINFTGNNQIGSALRLVESYEITAATKITISSDTENHGTYYAVLSGTSGSPDADISFMQPTIIDVGDGSSGLITTPTTGEYATHILVNYPSIISPVGGTAYVWVPAYQASTNNAVLTNLATIAGLTPINPSYASFVATNFQPAGTASPTFTGVVTIANGSASAPSLTFAGNSHVGLAYTNTNTLGLVGPNAGVVQAVTNDGSPNFSIEWVTAAVNYLQTQGAPTTFAANLSALGSDSNVGLSLAVKGTAVAAVGGGTAASITLGSGAGTVQFMGSGMFTANGTSSDCLAGMLGPMGIHTAVQKWFTFYDSGSTVRYGPAC